MRKNMAYILFANVLYLIIGLISSFVLPKFLSVDSYSYLKTFTLYVGYAGVIQLGYADGMYLFYGGKELKDIDDKLISSDINNYLIVNVTIGIIILFVSAIFNSFLGIIISIGMICDNLLGFFRSFFQAIGSFKKYGLALNIQKFSILILQLILVFAFHSDNYVCYAVVTIIVSFACAAYFFIHLSKEKRISLGIISLRRMGLMISQGIILLIGNFANLLFTSIDRWFIKALMTNLQFAQYSFAVSAESLINALISPVTVTFYNTFCKNSDTEYIRKSKRIATIIGLGAISTVYPIIWITNKYLPKYEDSVIPLVFLFGAHAFYAIVKGIYVNLYKVKKEQKKYLRQLLVLIIIAAILNGLLYSFSKNMNSFAIATFLTAFIWLIICEIQNPSIRFSFREWLFLLFLLGIFLFTNLTINEILGFIIYVISCIVSLKIILPRDFDNILGLIKNIRDRLIKP